MAFYGYRAFGPYAGLGAFGAGPELFVGGPSFLGGDDQAIFTGANRGFLQGAASIGYHFTPPTEAFMRAVAEKWLLLEQSPILADTQFFELMQSKLGVQLNSFYQAVSNHGSFGYTQDAQRQVVAIANQLKDTLNQIYSRNVLTAEQQDLAAEAAERQRVAAEAATKAAVAQAKAAADASKAAQAKAAADAAAVAAKLQQTQASIQAAKDAIADAEQAKAVAAASAVKNQELQAIAAQKSALAGGRTPWIIGGLAVLSAGAVYFARRKK